jgi:uncharacterized protein YifE (UPF0438 family)
VKSSTKIISIILFLSAFFMLISCQKQKAEWKGTIEEENRVTVVKNPKKPMYGENIFSLEEELSIGEAEGREEYMFSQIMDVGVDDEENIYILDFLESHIKVFSKSGEYLRTIGRRGQGPGEIQRAMNIHITPGNEILINDRGARYFHFLTLGGEYIRSIYQGRSSRPQVDSQNNIVARQTIIDTAEVRFILKKFDSELNDLFEIFSYAYESNPKIYNVYPPQCYWGVRSDDSIVWGYADKYEFQILDRNGRAIQKIIKDYEPVEITEEEKQEWVRFVFGDSGVPSDIEVNWDKYHNAFQSLNIDEEGRIFVQTYEKMTDGKSYYYDVFNPEGRYIAKIPLKTRPQLFKKNKLYTIEEDEEGYQAVKRYKVYWKN